MLDIVSHQRNVDKNQSSTIKRLLEWKKLERQQYQVLESMWNN